MSSYSLIVLYANFEKNTIILVLLFSKLAWLLERNKDKKHEKMEEEMEDAAKDFLSRKTGISRIRYDE